MSKGKGKDTDTEAASLKSRYSYLIDYDDDQRRVLESFRFRDQDQSIKSGAVLGFTGLVVASALVQLSSGRDSVVYLTGTEPWFALSQIGLLLLFASAACSLIAIVFGRAKYHATSALALLEFEQVLKRKRMSLLLATTFSASGTLATLGCLFATINL